MKIRITTINNIGITWDSEAGKSKSYAASPNAWPYRVADEYFGALEKSIRYANEEWGFSLRRHKPPMSDGDIKIRTAELLKRYSLKE